MATPKQKTHTPGPWEMKWMKDRGINSRGKHIEIAHQLFNEDGEYAGLPGGWHIVIGNKNCQDGYILDEANARLIAAAPDLLEALQELLRVDDEWHGAVNSEMAKARNKARAAIEKANHSL